MNGKNLNWIVWVGGIALLLCWGYGAAGRQGTPWASRQTQSHITPTQQQQPHEQAREGTIEIDSMAWSVGVVCDNSECIDAKILTEDVWWQIRQDRKDSRIITLYPRNWDKENKTLTIPESQGANILEWRIKPGQSVTRGTLVYAIHKKSEPHRY